MKRLKGLREGAENLYLLTFREVVKPQHVAVATHKLVVRSNPAQLDYYFLYLIVHRLFLLKSGRLIRIVSRCHSAFNSNVYGNLLCPHQKEGGG